MSIEDQLDGIVDDPGVSFQRYAHDKMLGGTPPAVDDQPRKKQLIPLAPSAFHSITRDKTVAWEVHQAFQNLERILRGD
jgi:hypothetical protein